MSVADYCFQCAHMSWWLSKLNINTIVIDSWQRWDPLIRPQQAWFTQLFVTAFYASANQLHWRWRINPIIYGCIGWCWTETRHTISENAHLTYKTLGYAAVILIFLLNRPQVNATRPHWWLVNIGSGYDLVPSGTNSVMWSCNKPKLHTLRNMELSAPLTDTLVCDQFSMLGFK